ncbi:MAG: N-acetylmuramoyl-L-alanine amidase [Lachnoclostridium sp.]|jgi:N-acetylmuramoyl-L-alanine amidase|nr:N-acetylmuramoyl-L-alanine amidase [Lachnoclostridium sp.]
MKKWIIIAFSVITIVVLLAAGRKALEETVIVIDSGHGGMDPGKVGVLGATEKEINLKIGLKVKDKLEKKKYQVVMTRTTDIKMGLKERVDLIEEQIPEIAVSIHQNSFTQSNVKGAQVFYYTGSEKGKKAAELMQESIKAAIGDGNTRLAKANKDYYMLRNTSVPFTIVECGFLSNSEEEQLLIADDYQERMAEAIVIGIEKYLDAA